MATSTVEDYVKAIFQICRETDALTSTGALARRLDVSDGTASQAIRALSELGLVEFEPYIGARLTGQGHELAMRVIRRHRLIESFLATVLGMEWDEIHEEAELLEHAVSEKLTDRIDHFLGHPTFDPHGDPIPTSDGSMPDSAVLSLDKCEPQTNFVVSRVLDQSGALLRYLSTVGLRIGAHGQIHEKSAIAGVISIKLNGQVITMGRPTAEKIVVSRPSKIARDLPLESTRSRNGSVRVS